MKKVGYFKIFAISLITIICQMAAAFILPPPFPYINLIAASIILMLTKYESGALVWLAFFMYFIVELYSGSFFGGILLSGTCATLISYWLYKYLFTNKSLFAVATMSFLNVLIQEAIFFFYVSTVAFFASTGYYFSTVGRLRSTAYSLLFTTLVTLALYLAGNYGGRRKVYLFSPR